MKKLVKVFSLLVLSLALFACGSGKKDEGTKEGIKVALLVGRLGDMSFNDSADRGVKKAKAELGMDVNVIEYGEPADAEASFLDAAEQGYDVIIGASDFASIYEEYAEQYEKTTFIVFDNQVDYTKGNGLKNVYSLIYKANEASYLAGYLSTKLSATDTLGFLGGMDIPVINDFLYGYIQGAQKASEGVKVSTSYVGKWTDSTTGKEMAFSMINQGADVIFGVAGGSGIGAIEAAVEKKLTIIGVDSDQSAMFRDQGKNDFADVIVTSVMKNVDNSLFRALDLYKKGELKVGQVEELGIKEEGVGLAMNDVYEAKVPAEVKEEIKALLEEITSGKITVETGYGKTTEQISQIRDSVRP